MVVKPLKKQINEVVTETYQQMTGIINTLHYNNSPESIMSIPKAWSDELKNQKKKKTAMICLHI